MPLRVGIDEAGYGPMLGPLVVAASVWDVPPDAAEADLWKPLAGAVYREAQRRSDGARKRRRSAEGGRRPRRGEWRLHVDDSKRVYQRDRGLHTLERAVLAFVRAARQPADSLRALLRAAVSDALDGGEVPWYAGLDGRLPLSGSAAACDGVVKRLTRCMETSRLRCTALCAEIVTEPQFNRRVESTRSKAAVVIEHVLRLVQRSAERAGDRDLHVQVDRLGGRTNYANLLRDAFPERHLHVVEVGDAAQRYRLAAAHNDWFIGFEVDADQRHLPVALASMFAKYLREAVMRRFNAFWRCWLPNLRPTAGYYGDAQRFLREITPVLTRAGVAREHFVRTR